MPEQFSYDALPYPSKFFLQTFPDRLAAAAILYGVESAPVEKCRVLELGCGNGSNLIAQAYGLSNSHFVGIDLSQTHIDLANQATKELDLNNIEFRQMDVMDMTREEFGEFDYITAHGLIAWVPEFVRSKVLAIFAEMLAHNGVGYISYNAYPGAYSREMVRSILQTHTDGIEDPQTKVDSAMQFLTFLSTNVSDRDAYGSILRTEQKRHLERLAADILHDDLGEVYQPFYFYEFARLLEENGLQFLSEAELHASSRQGFGDEVQSFLDSCDMREAVEQHLDLLRGRVFRQTLFCRKGLALNEKPDPSSIDGLYLSSSLTPTEDVELALGKIAKFRSTKGQQIQIDHPLTKSALVHLGEIWGRSISGKDLLNAAMKKLVAAGENEQDLLLQFETARSILLQIILSSDMIELHAYAPGSPAKAGYKPRVDRLARWQLASGNNVLTRSQKDLKLDDLTSRRLLELMDGTRSQVELERDLRPFIKSVDDLDDESKRELLGSLKSWIEKSIADLARLGLFES